MKVEKAFTIDGKIVKEAFQKGNIAVYKDDSDDCGYICYFVDNATGVVLFKQYITADMSQGVGYIRGVNFLG